MTDTTQSRSQRLARKHGHVRCISRSVHMRGTQNTPCLSIISGHWKAAQALHGCKPCRGCPKRLLQSCGFSETLNWLWISGSLWYSGFSETLKHGIACG